MNGEIIYFDSERGTGFIAGSDGNRYVFERSDVDREARAAKGVKVAFSVDGDRARNIVVTSARDIRGARSVPDAGSAEMPPNPVLDLPAAPAAGLFGYFRRCVTSNFANFRGRARRKEFWGFALFSLVAVLLVICVGLSADFALGNLKQVASDSDFAADGGPSVTFALGGVVWLALLVPSLAVTVRRIHDIGLSGWFILVNFIPSIGSLIVFVFTLIPSQRHPNKWGPVPPGVD